MKITYANRKTEKQCTSMKEALKLFGGNKKLATSLLARIEYIENAKAIKDIIVIPPFRFHNLKGKWDGYFAIDVKNVNDKWRIILRPLDKNGNIFRPCNIDEIASVAVNIEIKEVSPHYE